MTQLTESPYDDFVRDHPFAVIHIWAPWNDYDTQMKELLASLPQALRDLITFAQFECDPPDHWERCRRLEIRNLPFLAMYRNGTLTNTLTGLRKPEEIETLLTELIS